MHEKAQFSAVDSYNLVKTITATSALPTAFPFGVISGDMDLLKAKNGGIADETRAYRLEVIMKGLTAGTATVAVTGASAGGPEEHICSVAISSVGGIVESGSYLIVDSMDLTSTHLAGCSIDVADSANDRVAKLGFDAIGYQFIKFYVPTLTTITELQIYARYY